ncbi:MAG TPA: winged helix-turn-helix domain-containing protein [Candidatus Thermoplasmatota archaeon]|nr:winged helix-turn-helix domain-containing protein [Candidatus Thermoplasmatota archaeon]
MRTLPRRERWSIIGAIVDAIDHEVQKGEQARVSNLALRANLSYDRLQGYLAELMQAGLIEGERMPRLTPKGREFLREYRQWRAVLNRFGLQEVGERPHRAGPEPLPAEDEQRDPTVH